MPKPLISFFSSSSSKYLSEMETSKIQPRNFTDLELMDGMQDETSVQFLGFEIEKVFVFIDHLLIITILLVLSARKSKPVNFRALAHQ